MQTLRIETSSNESTIYCGEGSFENLKELVKYESLFIVTDTNVDRLYGDLLKKMFPPKKKLPHIVGKYVLPAGEKSKNYTELFNILSAMADASLTRGGCVLAMGGGVVGDIGGLAASLYMRGVHLVQIATTLLAQVDSSVGGKTAVDLGKIKNAVGTFYQPEIVIIDPMFLKTLPFREIRCGLGEILKYAAIDKGIYRKVSNRYDEDESLYDLGFIQGIIYDCVACKAKIVGEDEKDTTGRREYLNAGHTVGHSLELYYGLRSHGEYVAIGLLYEMYFAMEIRMCTFEFFNEFGDIILNVLGAVPEFSSIDKTVELALHDKKNTEGGMISVVAPCGEGKSCKIGFHENHYEMLLKEANRIMSEMSPSLSMCLIGEDVYSSTSDEIHDFICEKLGYETDYSMFSIPPSDFDSSIGDKLDIYVGINFTMPYKVSVIPYLDKLVGDAQVFGAVNTVCTATREGYNTDGDGFMLMLENAGIKARGKKVLLIGAGGAGRAVAKKLKDAGCDVDVHSEHGKSAMAVAKEFGCNLLKEISPEPYDIIVNASGVGMHESIGRSPVGEDVISKCGTAVDLIYAPRESEFLAIARRCGKKTLNGEAMLFYQAYYSDCIYLGLEADAKTAKKLYNAYIRQNERDGK
ncbi:MAG: hypothetical protein LUD29_00530 [Clostridia bacterium]|nr:hypothetical protein [Clostridia bacterium]